MTPAGVLVLGTGGTIGSRATGQGLQPTAGMSSLVSSLDTAGVRVDVEEVFALSSGAIGLEQIARINRAIDEARSLGYEGLVIAHGTDSLAETAFVLSVLRRGSSFPVVLTGSMRAPADPGSDAAANLRDAIAVAASGADFGSPVVVVFDAMVLPGVRTEKVSSTSLTGFEAPGSGPLGHVVEGSVVVLAREQVSISTSLALNAHRTSPVAVVAAMPGDDGASLRRCAEGSSGLVVSGLGAGHVSPQAMDALEHVAARMPVLVTTGTGRGPALRHTYAHAGSELDLLRAGAITGWSLGPRKAAFALSLCLGQTSDRQTIREALENDMRGPRT